MATRWYYGKDGVKHGPLSAAQIKKLADSGDLAPSDLVWKEGMARWVEASTVPGLFAPAAAESPPEAPRADELPSTGSSPALPMPQESHSAPPSKRRTASRPPSGNWFKWLAAAWSALTLVVAVMAAARATYLYLSEATGAVDPFDLLIALSGALLPALIVWAVLALPLLVLWIAIRAP